MTYSACAMELHTRVRLYATPHIGPQRFYQLLQHFGSAQAALSAPAHLWSPLGVPVQCHKQAHSRDSHQQADNTIQWLENSQHHVLTHDAPEYPALLNEIQTAPPLLFVEGDVSVLETPQLAIVGSRNASPSNQKTAFGFAQSLARSGCTITSGLASGIDTSAHQGALKAQGKTIAVVGTGLNHTYPRSNRALREQIVLAGGALVSEFFLDCPPMAANFPKRNRIISGLSLGVLVIEASLASGSLITARHAVEQNRDVFSVPGSIHYPGSKGCHQLLREGAILTESVQDILAAWQGWLAPQTDPAPEPPKPSDPIVKILMERAFSTDEIASLTGIPLTEILPQLTLLELDGKIYSQGGLWHYLPARSASV